MISPITCLFVINANMNHALCLKLKDFEYQQVKMLQQIHTKTQISHNNKTGEVDNIDDHVTMVPVKRWDMLQQ